ncbi:MAG TPA: transcription-repair coupling factor, partial [Verrucomicrobiae bacterium]
MQYLRQRLEQGGALSCAGVSRAAQPFLAVLLRQLFPHRPIVVVTDGLKSQESFHQDSATWLQVADCKSQVRPQEPAFCLPPSAFNLLFYPAWEVLPHEAKLPHADVISERLETLVALSHFKSSSLDPRNSQPPFIITSIAALLQRTFPADAIQARTRRLARGDHMDPLDLVEWLEDQGYEPEAQVNHKGEIAMRGGIVDIFPLISPWPVRLEFFGDELESLRTFDPITQISKEEMASVTIPPGGELGLLKQERQKAEGRRQNQPLATLLDYLPGESIFLFCEPEGLDEHAAQYAEQVPEGDPFFIAWEEFGRQLAGKGMTALDVESGDKSPCSKSALFLSLESLDAFRPMVERAAEPQIAEAQRREFFAQMHRWLRQGYDVQVFCNNDGERQRFTEIWQEYG